MCVEQGGLCPSSGSSSSRAGMRLGEAPTGVVEQSACEMMTALGASRAGMRGGTTLRWCLRTNRIRPLPSRSRSERAGRDRRTAGPTTNPNRTSFPEVAAPEYRSQSKASRTAAHGTGQRRSGGTRPVFRDGEPVCAATNAGPGSWAKDRPQSSCDRRSHRSPPSPDRARPLCDLLGAGRSPAG